MTGVNGVRRRARSLWRRERSDSAKRCINSRSNSDTSTSSNTPSSTLTGGGDGRSAQSESRVTGTGLQGGLAGDALPLTVHTYDTEGFPLPIGGRVLRVLLAKMNSSPVTTTITQSWEDLVDGAYTGSYSITKSGEQPLDSLARMRHPCGSNSLHVH